MKQCETFKFANVEIFRSFSISISKRNHAFDIRSFLFKQINFIKSFLVDVINIYEKSSRVAKIQNLNVFSSKRFAKIDVINANEICSFSIAKSISLISNNLLRSSNCSNFDDFMRFSNLDHVFFRVFARDLYEIFNQTNRFQIR